MRVSTEEGAVMLPIFQRFFSSLCAYGAFKISWKTVVQKPMQQASYATSERCLCAAHIESGTLNSRGRNLAVI